MPGREQAISPLELGKKRRAVYQSKNGSDSHILTYTTQRHRRLLAKWQVDVFLYRKAGGGVKTESDEEAGMYLSAIWSHI